MASRLLDGPTQCALVVSEGLLIDIEPTDGGCELTLVLETTPAWADQTEDGWNMIFNALVEALS